MDESSYSIRNEGPIQGQVIGDHPSVHQHFYPTATLRQPSWTPEHAWNIPYRRNRFFTGRENLLQQLHDHLVANKATALTQPQAISGLGGIGKTQIAVEYAYRYRSEYQQVLWARAATRDSLIADYVTLAALLYLPEKDEQDQHKIVAAVKGWLAHHDQWLLILDNADDLAMTSDFLPPTDTGHIVFTTRAQTAGTIAQSLEVQEMDRDEGTLLLLRRAGVLVPDALLDKARSPERATAEAIVAVLDGLPLALDQAGAYIEETQCSLESYLKQYQQRQFVLLHRRGGFGSDHPEPVATTWSLSFEQVERLNPMAAELLQFLAFLAPDAIPEALIVEGASVLSPLLRPVATDPAIMDEAIATLHRFSFVRRNREKHTLSLHRLVQVVMKANMDKRKQKQLVKQTIRAVNRAFPNVEDVEAWPQCQQYLSQAQVCADLINKYNFDLPEAARLLNQTAYFLCHHALYEEAEPFSKCALSIMEKVLGSDHPDTATCLHTLAVLYYAQGKYEQAEPFYQRALAIKEKVLGLDHPDTATCLNTLALLYKTQGKYEQAEPFYQRALAIREKVLGLDHPDTATARENLTKLLEEVKRKGKR